MISDKLLAELKQILIDDYQIQLPEKDLSDFAGNLKGLFGELTRIAIKKEKQLSLIIKNNDNDENTNQTTNKTN